MSERNGHAQANERRFNYGEAHEGDMPDEAQRETYDPELEAADSKRFPILTYSELQAAHPKLRDPLIDGLSREGEAMNIIAASKVGKSWLAGGLAFAVARGGYWLDSFKCTQGGVLLIDNELHPETMAFRLRRIAEAMHLSTDAIGERVCCVSLRGRLMDLNRLERHLIQLGSDRFKLIILDAFYRAVPAGTDENDNGTMAHLYNLLDYLAAEMRASWAIIHHASKGDQSAKSVTDVGAGAGSMSRATDTHLILRPHEEDGAVVLDAAVRSWAPVMPRCLKFEFPLWRPAPDLDPSQLRQPRPRRAKPEGQEGGQPVDPPWDARRFAGELGKPEPETWGQLIERAIVAGLKESQAERIAARAVDCGYLHSWQEHGTHGRKLVSTMPRPVPPTAIEAPKKRPGRPQKTGGKAKGN